MSKITIQITSEKDTWELIYLLLSGAQIMFGDATSEVLSQIKPHIGNDFPDITDTNFTVMKEIINDNPESIKKIMDQASIIQNEVTEKVQKIESGIIDNSNEIANCFNAVIELTSDLSKEIITRYDVFPGDRFNAKVSPVTKIAYFSSITKNNTEESLGISPEMYKIISQ